MDQVKKHQFWIITGVAVVLGIVSYAMTSSKLNKLYADQAQALDAKFNDVSTTKGKVATHPNDHSKAKMQAIIDALAQDVKAAWLAQYERQVPLMKWPEGALENKRLIEKLQIYSPIETTLTYPEPAKSIVKGDQMAYARYFQDQMPRIAAIIGCEWVGKASEVAAGGAMGGMGAMGMGDGALGMPGSGSDSYAGGMPGGPGMESGFGMNMPRKPTDLVIWPKASQDELINAIRLWRGDTPTVYEILYTQENMWILEGLMNIIATTNQGAVENFQASIKEIEFIRIGKPAVGKAGVIDPPMKANAGMGSMGMDMGMGGMEGMEMGMGSASDMMGAGGGSMMGSAEDGADPTAMMAISDPANGRYVDANFAPLTGDDIRSKMQNATPEDAYFAVAKRVPVRLRFKMDQRKIPKLLANCGNADLMLEIKQVRIGDTTPAPTSAAGGMMGGMGGMYGSGGGDSSSMGAEYGGSDSTGSMMGGSDMMGGMGGSMMGGSMMGGGMGAMAPKPTWEMPVEIYGVVYLYNPVSMEQLGLDKVTSETEVSDTVDNPDTSSDVPENMPASGAAPQAPANPAANGESPLAPEGAPVAPGPVAPGPAAPGPAAPGPAAAGVDPNAAAAAAPQ